MYIINRIIKNIIKKCIILLYIKVVSYIWLLSVLIIILIMIILIILIIIQCNLISNTCKDTIDIISILIKKNNKIYNI